VRALFFNHDNAPRAPECSLFTLGVISGIERACIMHCGGVVDEFLTISLWLLAA